MREERGRETAERERDRDREREKERGIERDAFSKIYSLQNICAHFACIYLWLFSHGGSFLSIQ